MAVTIQFAVEERRADISVLTLAKSNRTVATSLRINANSVRRSPRRSAFMLSRFDLVAKSFARPLGKGLGYNGSLLA